MQEQQRKDISPSLKPGFIERNGTARIFWLYLVGGTLFWLVVFYLTGVLYSYTAPQNVSLVGGSLFAIVGIIYFWGIVFSLFTGVSLWKSRDPLGKKVLFSVLLTVYVLVFLSGLMVFAHVSSFL